VDHAPGGQWLVRCDDGPEERGADLAETILAAGGVDEPGAVSRDAQAAWAGWAREHAARIVAEAEREY